MQGQQHQGFLHFESSNNPEIKLSLKELSDRQVNLKVVDSQKFIKYYEDNVILNKINTSTIKRAFQQKDSSISYSLKSDSQSLTLTITINSPFIQKIQEIITFNHSHKISQMETYQTRMKMFQKKFKEAFTLPNNKIVAYRSQLRINAPGVYDELYNQEEAYQWTELISINLPDKAKYEVTLSMIVKTHNGQNFCYIYANHSYNDGPFGNLGGFYAQPNQNVPFKISMIVQSPTPDYSHGFQLYDTYDYPVTCTNILVSAEKIN